MFNFKIISIDGFYCEHFELSDKMEAVAHIEYTAQRNLMLRVQNELQSFLHRLVALFYA